MLGKRIGSLLSFLAGIALASVPSAQADINEFVFQLVQQEVKIGEAVVAVRIVHRSTGALVPDAVIFARRLDMAPEGMPTMTSNLEPLPPEQPGIYRFRTSFTMEGSWQLSLAAKIQGESGTLKAQLALKAKD